MTVAQKNVRTWKPLVSAGFASAVVLAAGLALIPACNKSVPSASPKSSVSSVQNVSFRSECESDKDDRDAILERKWYGPNPPKYSGSDSMDQEVLLGTITGLAREYAGVGLNLPKFGVVTEKQTVKVGDVVHGRSFDRYHPKVTKIDDRGVELDGCDKIRYGRTDGRGGEFVLMDFIRADKGPEDGTAAISITYPTFAGMKQTGNSK